MAATIARCLGYKKDGNPNAGEASRLGAGGSWAQAATWHTFADVNILPDGRGTFILRRHDEAPFTVSWGPEGVKLSPVTA